MTLSCTEFFLRRKQNEKDIRSNHDDACFCGYFIFSDKCPKWICEKNRHESVIVRIIDGWEVVDEIRFVGQKYIATDNLKIREYSSLSAKQVGRLSKEERVTVIEVGEKTTIDGITSA